MDGPLEQIVVGHLQPVVQHGLSYLHVAAHEVDVRIDLQGPAIFLQSFMIQTLAEIQIPQVVVSLGELSIGGDGFLVLGLRQIKLSPVSMDDPQAEMGLGVIRVNLDGPAVFGLFLVGKIL